MHDIHVRGTVTCTRRSGVCFFPFAYVDLFPAFALPFTCGLCAPTMYLLNIDVSCTHTLCYKCLFLIYLYRTNTNVNDALGDYSLTLVDSLDTLVVRREGREYRKGRGGRGEGTSVIWRECISGEESMYNSG